MKKVATVLAVLAMSAVAYGGTIAYTSFEEPATGGKYYDTGDAAVDHALVNNSGEAPVNYTSTGGELGFSAYYTNTRNDVGLTDGDYVGVSSYTGEVGSYTDGSQGYQISDPDGMMTTTLDAVTLSGYPSYEVSVDVWVIEGGYETDPLDSIRVWVDDDGTDVDLLNESGDAIEDIDGSWMTLTSTLSGSSAVLKFEVDANAGSEGIYVDNVKFTGVPEPATMALLCLGSLFLRIRRR